MAHVAMLFGAAGVHKPHCKMAAVLLLELKPELAVALQRKDYLLVTTLVKNSAPLIMSAISAAEQRYPEQWGSVAASSGEAEGGAPAGASSRALTPADAGSLEVDMLDAQAAADAAAEAVSLPTAPPATSAPAGQHEYDPAEYDWEPSGEGQQAYGSPAQQQPAAASSEEVTSFLRTIELTSTRDMAGMSNEELVAVCGPWASAAGLLRDVHAGVLATKQVFQQVGFGVVLHA